MAHVGEMPVSEGREAFAVHHWKPFDQPFHSESHMGSHRRAFPGDPFVYSSCSLFGLAAPR
jgi:hypothetical protein